MVLADRFELEEPIGRGGMGEVWRAKHLKLRSPVAIKLLNESVAAEDDAAARFLTEAQAAAAIRGNYRTDTNRLCGCSFWSSTITTRSCCSACSK